MEVDASKWRGEQSLETSLDPMIKFAKFPQVRYMILASLSVPDLLKCTQVSHLWQQIAGQILASAQCFAYIRWTCKNVCKLNDVLGQSRRCPINALSIDVKQGHENCYGCPMELESRAWSTNLMQLPLRTLDLHVNSCEVMQQVMHQILLGVRNTLELLLLTYTGDSDDDSVLAGSCLCKVCAATESIAFPKLKAIKLQPPSTIVPQDVFDLVRIAPNLKTVEGKCCLEDIEEHGCPRLEVFTMVDIIAFEESESTLQSLVHAKPKLVALGLCDTDGEAIPSSWSTHILQLFRVCALTLKRVSICAIEMMVLNEVERLTLGSLDFLELFFPEDSTTAEIHDILAGLRLHDSCPSLHSVRLAFGDDCLHDVNPHIFAKPPANNPYWSVLEVLIQEASCAPSVAKSCISYFPTMSKFGFELLACADLCEISGQEHFFELHKLWTEVTTLEELKVCLVGPRNSAAPYSLDALFCGISTDEVHFLVKLNEGGIGNHEFKRQTWEFCPIRPSLLYAQRLKKVWLVISPNYKQKLRCIPILSADLIFTRMPELELIVDSYASKAPDELYYLESVAKVRHVTGADCNNWW